MEDMLVWIVLLFIAWIAEGIASARRKKKRGQAQSGRTGERAPRPARRPARPDAPAEPRPRGPAPRTPERPSRVPEPGPVVLIPPEVVIVRQPPPERVPVPEGLWAEGAARKPTVRQDTTLEREPTIASLETLEPAGGASHVAFHEKYVDRPPPPPTVRRRLHLQRGDARRGIILAEILGPPKSER